MSELPYLDINEHLRITVNGDNDGKFNLIVMEHPPSPATHLHIDITENQMISLYEWMGGFAKHWGLVE